jgi:hypothetical protein
VLPIGSVQVVYDRTGDHSVIAAAPQRYASLLMVCRISGFGVVCHPELAFLRNRSSLVSKGRLPASLTGRCSFGSGVKTPALGLKGLQPGGPGEYRFSEALYHRRRSEPEHRPVLWAGQFAGNEKQLIAELL